MKKYRTGADVSGAYQGQSTIDWLSNLLTGQDVQAGQVKQKTAETQTKYHEDAIALFEQIMNQASKKASKFGKVTGIAKLFSRALDPTGTLAAVIGAGEQEKFKSIFSKASKDKRFDKFTT